MGVKIIAIAGGSGSGKTTLAGRLAQSLVPARAQQLSLDRYYQDIPNLSPAERAQRNYDDPAAVDFMLLKEQLAILATGTAIEAPRYDFVTHRREERTDRINPLDVLVVEGVLLLVNQRLRALFDFSVFIDTPDEVRFERRLRRDVDERGRSDASVRTQWELSVQPMYLRHCYPSRVHADRVIQEDLHGGDCFKDVIEEIRSRTV